VGFQGGQISYLSKRCLLFALSFLLAACGAKLLAQTGGVVKVIKIDGKDVGPASSAGVLANQTLYVAGQDGRNADGSLPKDFQQEASQALRHVQGVLRAAGMDFGNAVWINVYVTHAQDIAAMNDVYWQSIGDRPPARTVLVVGALPHEENIEINCIAVSSAARRQVIHPQGWPQGGHIDPAGIQADDVLYMSAQGGADPLTGKLAADFAGEVKQALDNVATIAKTANMSMASVVWVNPYLSSTGADQGEMNKIYATYFEFGNTPGRGTIQVVDLPDTNHVVFSCIAGADLAKRKSIRPINMPPSPTASPGILYDDTYYMSAKSGFIPGQGIVTPDVGLQLRQSMRNLLDDLQQTDLDFPDVVSATVYLQEMKNEAQVEPLYSTFFKDHFPAQTLLQQSFDMKTATTEQISLIAVRQPQH
jgi:enamine deaminase RidA (YjgF/YER057c/UK114 family)